MKSFLSSFNISGALTWPTLWPVNANVGIDETTRHATSFLCSRSLLDHAGGFGSRWAACTLNSLLSVLAE
jgi:hypothetical protein